MSKFFRGVYAASMLFGALSACTYRVVLDDEREAESAAAPSLRSPDGRGQDGAASSGPPESPVSLSGLTTPQPRAGTAPGPASATAPAKGGASAPSTGPALPADQQEECAKPRASRSRPCHDDPDPCGLKSGFAGDEYCLRAPPLEEGIQIHLGPTSYSDPAETERYVIAPGEDLNVSLLANLPSIERRWSRVEIQMRPGVHHWIAKQVAGPGEARRYENFGCDGAVVKDTFGSGLSPVYTYPQAPENQNTSFALEPNGSACADLHVYNFTERPLLAEVWINLYFVDDSLPTQEGGSVVLIGGLDRPVRPGEAAMPSYRVTAAGPGRITELVGEHYYPNTPRLSVRLNDRLIYDSVDADGAPTYSFDTVTTNPPLGPSNTTDGAFTGPIEFEAGDELTLSCETVNPFEFPITHGGDPTRDVACSLYGRTVGSDLRGTFP